MRIALLTTSLEHGGMETLVIDLALQFKMNGHEVIVITMLDNISRADKLQSSEIEVITLHMKRGVYNPSAVLGLSSVLRKWKPDVVHSHGYPANILGRVARVLYREPVLVSTAHNIIEGGKTRDIIYRLTDRLCNITTNVSKKATDKYVQAGAVPGSRIRFIPNGIDTSIYSLKNNNRDSFRQQLGVPVNAFVWLAVGRFDVAKDYPNLIDALAQIKGNAANVYLLIAGSGPLEAEMKAYAASKDLANSIAFLGVRNDIAALMNAADAFVMSSKWEGMPMVLLEASASGLPIVATDAGGNSEVVKHGETGYIVPISDSAALAQAMYRMLGLTESERLRMALSGKEYAVQHYDIKAIANIWLDLYVTLQ